MTSGSSSFEVRVGSRISIDGQEWDVAELDGAAVRLHAADTIRTVSLSTLAQVTIDNLEPGQTPESPGAWDPSDRAGRAVACPAGEPGGPEANQGRRHWVEGRYNRLGRHSAIRHDHPVRFEELHPQSAQAAERVSFTWGEP